MPTVGILGAGAMGSGIAQVAISAGWSARLIDVNTETLDKAIEGIGKRLDRNVEKERMSAEDAASARQRLHASSINDLADCEVFIEAIVEDIDIKVQTSTKGKSGEKEKGQRARNRLKADTCTQAHSGSGSTCQAVHCVRRRAPCCPCARRGRRRRGRRARASGRSSRPAARTGRAAPTATRTGRPTTAAESGGGGASTVRQARSRRARVFAG